MPLCHAHVFQIKVRVNKQERERNIIIVCLFDKDELMVKSLDENILVENFT